MTNFKIECSITHAEEGGLEWLAEKCGWLDVVVTRRSGREFDLDIDGTEKAGRFGAWFVLAALYEFWHMRLISVPFDDWSFCRDAGVDTNWAEFGAVLAGRRPRARHPEAYAVTLKGN